MSPDKLVRMANQIARFFATGADGDPAEAVAGHINAFWEPRMRRQLLRLGEADLAALDPLVKEALKKVHLPA